MDLEQIISVGERLGYVDDDLRAFVKKSKIDFVMREQQNEQKNRQRLLLNRQSKKWKRNKRNVSLKKV